MDLHINSTNGSRINACGPLTDYYIPDYILKPASKPVTVYNVL
jgi:diacylglycerol kinase (ATP)